VCTKDVLSGCDEMARAVAIAALAVIVAAALAAYLLLKSSGGGERHGLIIVVSFPNLVDDIKPLLCQGDRVYSLAPPGSDPHSYQLTVKDYRLLKEADLVITTGHAPFEVEVAKKTPKSKLIVIPYALKASGGKILVNPNTGQENLHMPIYDPENYKIFIRIVAVKLASLNPKCKNFYLSKSKEVESEVDNLVAKAPRLNVDAVGSEPPVQYAVSWMGIHIVKFLLSEHGLSPTPSEITAVRDLLSKGEARLVVIMVDSKGEPLTPVDAKLESIAKKYNVPVLKVPAPYLPGSMLEKLKIVVSEVEGLAGRLSG
jgi:zinc/manganese transport system substrate-binding protein